jgi:hypothetical protein
MIQIQSERNLEKQRLKLPTSVARLNQERPMRILVKRLTVNLKRREQLSQTD